MDKIIQLFANYLRHQTEHSVRTKNCLTDDDYCLIAENRALIYEDDRIANHLRECLFCFNDLTSFLQSYTESLKSEKLEISQRGKDFLSNLENVMINKIRNIDKTKKLSVNSPFNHVYVIIRAKNRFEFGDIWGLGKAFRVEKLLPAFSLSKEAKKSGNFVKPKAKQNSDYRIKVYGWKGKECIVRIEAKKPGKSIEGILVEFFNGSGQFIGSKKTDAEGEVHFKLPKKGPKKSDEGIKKSKVAAMKKCRPAHR